jgi:Protein of unknown function (DUF4013)
MDIEKAFAFPFEDKEWAPKLGLGAAISLVPILNFAWSGYMVGIIRNVMDSASEPLPTWDDFSKKFMDGLIIVAASLIYALPIIIFVCLPLSVLAFSGILSGNSNTEDLARTMAGAGGVLFTCFLCMLGIYGLALSFIHPVILVMFAREGTFASCFKLREAFDLISRNMAPFFTAWGIGIVAGLAVGLLVAFINAVVSWIPCLGWIVGMALSVGSVIYSTVVYAHLFGQFGREAFGQKQLAVTG